jgi:hypothetical protein
MENISDAEALKQLRILVRENLLPRITELEEQLRLLRRVTWPVCQRLTEKSPFADIESKRVFLQFLEDEEVWDLLMRKAQGRPIVGSEFDRIRASAGTHSTIAKGPHNDWFP